MFFLLKNKRELINFYSKTNQMHQCIKFILFDTLQVWTVFPPIIRISRLYTQQQAFVKQSNRYCYCLLGSSNSICLTNTCCCMYSPELLMMDGKTVRNM